MTLPDVVIENNDLAFVMYEDGCVDLDMDNGTWTSPHYYYTTYMDAGYRSSYWYATFISRSVKR